MSTASAPSLVCTPADTNTYTAAERPGRARCCLGCWTWLVTTAAQCVFTSRLGLVALRQSRALVDANLSRLCTGGFGLSAEQPVLASCGVLAGSVLAGRCVWGRLEEELSSVLAGCSVWGRRNRAVCVSRSLCFWEGWRRN